MKRVVQAVLLLAVALVGVAVVIDPRYALRYARTLVHGPDNVPRSFYSPSALVRGGDAPAPPRVTPEEERIDPAALELAVQYAEPRATEALLVARNGHLVFERYFAGTSFDTVASGHSFNKTLTALMVGAAIADRRILSVDERASKYLPEWRDDARRDITIRHLLWMSSGLASSGSGLMPWSAAMRESLGTDIAKAYFEVPLSGVPGRTWRHQDVDPQMLGLIVQRATGRPYAEYLSEKLWRPLGAGDAWLWLDRTGGLVHANCCILARQGDWIRLGMLLAGDGLYAGEQVVPSAWLREMRTPAPGNPNYGYQLWLGEPFVAVRPYDPDRTDFAIRAGEPYAARDLFFLDGFGKYRLWIVPSLRLVILRTGRDPDSGEDWDDAIIPNLVIRGVLDRPRAMDAPGADVDPATLVPAH
jgi:CubicO group peptidase (beta-lactamase class C family)